MKKLPLSFFGCCSLWKSFMKNKCFDSSLTRSRLQTNKYPKQNRINVFYQIYCFTRQQNKWCCLYACEKIVCNQDIFNETKCPRSASFISDQAIWPRQLSNLISDLCVVVVIVNWHKFRSETKKISLNKRIYRGVPWGPGSQSLKHIWYLPVYSVSAPSPPEYIKLTTGTSLRKAIFLFLSCGQLPVSDRWTFNKTFKNYQKSWLKFCWIFF